MIAIWNRVGSNPQIHPSGPAAGAQAEAPGLNLLSKPEDGRAFMLAASDEQTLARRLRRRAAAGVVGFIASASALTWVLTRL